MYNTAMNMEEFEMQIRADERAKIQHEMRMRKIERAAQKRKKVALIKQYAIQRIMALAIIIDSILFITSGWAYDIEMQANDGTFLLITIPLGLYLLFTKDLCIS